MNVKQILFFLGLIGLGQNYVVAQQLNQSIRGTVIDRESEATLPGASVVITSTDPPRGVSTDLNGVFEITDVPIGRHSLKFSFIGYEDVILPQVLVGSAKEVILNISLSESFQQLEEVVISADNPKERANNDMATVSARSFSTDETSRFAASADDPARMALSFAGVSTTNDVSNEIVIRGNSPLGMLWRINGVEVPSPNHFTDEGASGGGISALSINMLDNSDFFTGAFPAEYGNATSGVFDVRLRNGNNKENEYAFQLGVLGTDISAEGPFKKGYAGSYLINYRYSTLTVLTEFGIIDTDGNDNVFQDLAYQFNMPTKNAGIFKVFGLVGKSSSIGIEDRDTVLANPADDFFDTEFKSNMGVMGLSHKYFFSNKTYLESIFSFSRQEIGFTEEKIDSVNLSKNLSYEDEFINDAARINLVLNHKVNSKHSYRLGLIGSELSYKLYGKGEDDDEVFRTFLADNGSTIQGQAYAQWKFRMTEKWTLNSGLHALYFALNENSSIEPRLGISYQHNSMNRFSFGFGLHSRTAPLSLYNANTIDEFGIEGKENRDVKLSKAFHYVVGYDRQLSENVRLKIEAYYQSLVQVPVVDDPNTSYSGVNAVNGYNTRILSSEGTADNVGLELTLERFFRNNYYYLLTVSLFDSKYQMPDGREFDTRFNTNHILSALTGKEYVVGKSGKNRLAWNLKFLWAGGNRYKPIDLQQSQLEDKTVRIESEGYSASAPDYYRLDAGFEYRINKERVAHIISLSVQNVTNRLNVFNQYYDSDKNRVETEYQFGIIPILKYRFEF